MTRRALILVCLGLAAVVGFSQLPKLGSAVRSFTLPLNHSSIIREQAADKNLSPALVAAVIYAETKFEARTSSAGAQGLMQLLPSTALFIAKKSGGTSFVPNDLSDPEVNIRYGTWYLRYLMGRYSRNEFLAVAAYNAGMGNVDKWLEKARLEGHPLRVSDIPFPETKAYVQRVLDAKSEYSTKYGTELGLR